MEVAIESYLVTTSLEETWPKECPTDYLGKWCLVVSGGVEVRRSGSAWDASSFIPLG